MGGRLLEGPTMGGRMSDWKVELERFLKPFLDRLGHKARRQMCPLYVSGLIGPGDRKSIQPMAERLSLGEYDQLHHFIAAGVWDAAPVETELLVGGCWLWAERTIPPGAHSSQTCLGRRYSSSPQSVPCQCADDLAGCWARSSS